MGERRSITLCPFLHFDNARTHSYEHNVSIVSWNVKSVLDFLEVNPNHKFCLDQITLLEGFRHLFPNLWDALHQKVLEGRVEIVGGTYVMPDFIIPDGESIIRQFQYGIGFIKTELGVVTKSGWAIDSAGHCSQMPQILRQCGIDTYYISKGVPYDAPSEFVWMGPDGSRVNTAWLRDGFDRAAWLSENTREAFSKLLELLDSTEKRSVSNNLMFPVGGELVPPPMHLSDIVDQWNKSFPETRASIGTAYDFSEKLKAVQSDLPIISGILDSGRYSCISSGGLSNRPQLKLLNRQLENLLYLAELYLSMAHDISHEQDLRNIWLMLLFNQDHNIIRGTITDEPYKLAIRRYKQGIEKAGEILENAISDYASNLNSNRSGQSFVVFNPLPWERSDIVRFPVDSSSVSGDGFALIDDRGELVPYQKVNGSQEGTIFDIVFIADNVPSLGHRVYTITAATEIPEFDTGLKYGSNWMESKKFIIELDIFSSSISRIFDKTLKQEFIRGNGIHFVLEPDVGDLYRFMPSQLSDEDSMIDSSRISGKAVVVESGPVRVVFETSIAMGSSEITQRVTVYSSLSRIDVEIDLDFKETLSRLRFKIPVPIYVDEVSTGSQFMVQKKQIPPAQITTHQDHGHGTFSALDWVDCSNAEIGLGLTAPGLHAFSYQDGEIEATLLRSVSKLSLGKDDEVLRTKTASARGKHAFRISLLPHEFDWSRGMTHRRSAEHRLPLMAYPIDSEGESIEEKSSSFFVIEGNELELSCLKPTSNPSEYIIRLYEVQGKTGSTTLRFNRNIARACLVDFLENEIGELNVIADTLELSIDPHSIVTIKIKMAGVSE